MGMGSCGVMDSWLGPALGLSVLAMGEAMCGKLVLSGNCLSFV